MLYFYLIKEATVPQSESELGHSLPINEEQARFILTGKLQSLKASERSEIERIATARGEAYVLAQWGTLIEQLRYINTL